MAVGMGTVFAFLTLLVGCMNVAGAVFSRLPLEVEEEDSPAMLEDEAVLMAVALAVAERERA